MRQNKHMDPDHVFQGSEKERSRTWLLGCRSFNMVFQRQGKSPGVCKTKFR